ncbi:DNA-damage-inducible protein J [Erwinia toletana]|uniref:DNA-damage-inducible protein J n=1 Tax=Winslowiella toletana TaxID=92490 RepID=A0ABS4PE06_9GAMM|nr:type II toxin-antitoxin system RelB/DinJ family antitoxin [Winslowiella toletana]MBP2170864.1 DNA-damage-inducible protein J [Winslowiella toletana]
MAANSLVQTRIDTEVKEKATAVLERLGLTVSDAVRILLTRVACEGGLPPGFTTDAETYDLWFRAKVQEALDDPRPALADGEVKQHFSERKALLRKR